VHVLVVEPAIELICLLLEKGAYVEAQVACYLNLCAAHLNLHELTLYTETKRGRTSRCRLPTN
jgi:hypothetical protein